MIRIAKVLAVLIAAWIALLFVLGFVLAARTGYRVTARLGESLQGSATMGTSSLGLVRGNLDLERLSVRRDDAIGTLALDVGEVHCDLPPLGLALIDRTCGVLEVEDVRLEVSTTALFQLHKPKRQPVVAERVVIDDAELVFSPSAFVPGFGRVQIKIEHAEAGHTAFKTPLSWLFALDNLRAVFELPAGITLRLTYADGKLGAAGSLFGSKPVELPVKLPVLDGSDDARSETEKLVKLAKDLAEELVARRAEDWLKSKL